MGNDVYNYNIRYSQQILINIASLLFLMMRKCSLFLSDFFFFKIIKSENIITITLNMTKYEIQNFLLLFI